MIQHLVYSFGVQQKGESKTKSKRKITKIKKNQIGKMWKWVRKDSETSISESESAGREEEDFDMMNF